MNEQTVGKIIAELRAENEKLKAENLLVYKVARENEKLRTANADLVEALKFYADGLNLEIKGDGVIRPRGDTESDSWRIGGPYLVSAEMGQVAAKALAKHGGGK